MSSAPWWGRGFWGSDLVRPIAHGCRSMAVVVLSEYRIRSSSHLDVTVVAEYGTSSTSQGPEDQHEASSFVRGRNAHLLKFSGVLKFKSVIHIWNCEGLEDTFESDQAAFKGMCSSFRNRSRHWVCLL